MAIETNAHASEFVTAHAKPIGKGDTLCEETVY
ncbi:hypothetical protein SAMN05421663_10565 [Terribacillus halophilus]|uniref:Uncharacterized protein n=1 Tax=Terribacillus halophilus TaxID=361279 RepID=A0A1G6QHT6_9BACI|nr:hypothetical protein SAMN05421663_10565 [Terribacillus halophilus]